MGSAMTHSILTRPGTKTLCLAVALALIVLPGLRRAGSEAKAVSIARAMDAEALRARNSSAFAKILGELRLGAADLMFVKTERYLHGGVGYTAHADDGADAGDAEIAKLGEENVHGDYPHEQVDEDDNDHEDAEPLDAANILAESNNRSAVIEEDDGHEYEHEPVATAIRTRRRSCAATAAQITNAGKTKKAPARALRPSVSKNAPAAIAAAPAVPAPAAVPAPRQRK